MNTALNTMEPNNSQQQFTGIIEKHKSLLFKVANMYCRNAEDRKDLLQEIVLQLWRSFSNYNDAYQLSTWMYRVALNVSISFYRKQNTRQAHVSSWHEAIIEWPDEPVNTETEANIKLLHQFIRELKELDKALMLLYLEEKKYKEMADILGISETNVATKVGRIKQRLKERFAQVKG
jgi:RNA polymerase sigma factor (sigma-70 family)